MNKIKLLRPINLAMLLLMLCLFRFCIVAASPYRLFYVEPVLTNAQFVLLLMATLFTAAGGYVINDIFDVDIDAVNKNNTQIIGNTVSEEDAYRLYKILCFLGIASTLLLALFTKNYRLSMIPILIMLVLNFYAHTFKKQLIVGNFMISLCAAFVFILMALYESGGNTANSANSLYIKSGITIAAIVYGLFAFLTTFLREIIKDIEDIEGDEQYNCKTIPIVFGTKIAKIVSIVLILFLLVMLGSFAWFFPTLNMKMASYGIAIGFVLPLLVMLILIVKATTNEHFHFISNAIKIFMLLGTLTLLYFYSGNGPYVFVQYVNFLKKLV